MKLKTYLKGLGLGIFVTALIMSLSADNAKGEMSDSDIIARAEELGMVSENAMLLKEAQALADSAAGKSSAMKTVSSPDSTDNADKTSVSINGKISENKTVSSNGEIVDTPIESSSSSSTREPAGTKTSDKEDKTGTAGGGTDDTPKTKLPEETVETPAEAGAPAVSEEASGETLDNGGELPEVVIINVSSGDSSISVATKMAQAGLITDARQFDSYLVLSGYDRRLVVGPHPIPRGATAAEMGALLTSKQ